MIKQKESVRSWTSIALIVSTIAVLAVVARGIDVRTQSVAISEAQAREWATYAASKAADDPKAFDDRFQVLARILAPSYRADPFSPGVTIYTSDGLVIGAVGQVSNFQSKVSEAVRKLQSIDKTPWPCGATLDVFPSRIDSPDIERIVVRRAGMTINPIHNDLVSTPMTTRAGGKVALHSGSVCYAPSTFAPGVEVTVIAIPVTGTNITKTLNDADLRMII